MLASESRLEKSRSKKQSKRRQERALLSIPASGSIDFRMEGRLLFVSLRIADRLLVAKDEENSKDNVASGKEEF